MIVFIDESGDPGFKLTRGSSAHFVIALVIFDEELDAEEAAIGIKRMRQSLGKSERFEFKFNKCNKDFRCEFLSQIKKSNFRIRAIVFDKQQIYSNILRESKESFYNFSLRQVLEHNNDTIKEAKIRLDGRGEREFRTQLSGYLKRSLNNKTKRVLQNIRFKDSKNDVLIQAADMIAGSIRRYYDKKTNDWDVYRKIIETKEEDVWEFK